MSFRLGKLDTRIYFILFAGICQENFKRVQFKAVLHIQVRRTWITGPAQFSIDIQVLTDLKRRLSREVLHPPENPILLKILIQKEKGAMPGEGQALALRWRGRFRESHRSAGACPPRVFDWHKIINAWRGTGPRATVIRQIVPPTASNANSHPPTPHKRHRLQHSPASEGRGDSRASARHQRRGLAAAKRHLPEHRHPTG